jgi:hypothetical protein
MKHHANSYLRARANALTAGLLVSIPFSFGGCGEGGDTASPLESHSNLAASIDVGPQTGVVPAGKVATPGRGLVDHDCVFEAPDDATITAQGDVLVNGVVVDHHTPCSPSQMGAPRDRHRASPPSVNGWIEDTDTTSNTFFKSMNARWIVPPAPLDTGNKIVYFFPSFENDIPEIIQPVLQYGGNGVCGGNYWVIASWYCYPSGCHHSACKNVFPGDTIYGSIDFVSQSGNTAIYSMTAMRLNSGVSTTLTINTNAGFRFAEGGVLEAYSIQVCPELPPGGSVMFNNIYLFDNVPGGDRVKVHPLWRNEITTGLNPQCSYGVSSGNDGVTDFTTLFFH